MRERASERASEYGWMGKTNSAVPERNKNIKKEEKTDQKGVEKCVAAGGC